jgi:periplasmic protein TonB
VTNLAGGLTKKGQELTPILFELRFSRVLISGADSVIVAPHDDQAAVQPFAGIRTILVAPDIVAVARRSPAPPVTKKPPWRPRSDGGPIEKSGGRHWFTDRIFVEAQHERLRGGLGGSIGVHALVVTLVLVLAAQFERTLVVKVHQRLVMPAMLLMPPMSEPPPRASKSIQHSSGDSQPSAGARDVAPPPAPIEIPSTIEPETGNEASAGRDEGGVIGGVAGGIGQASGESTGSSGTSSSGPLRLGNTLAPPRKIKDVRPAYPPLALLTQARGTVVIEITIGTDGTVREATVVHSVPQLDQAALEAVRQWEYEPTRVNGTLVSLIMTVVVNFAIQ